MFDPNFHAVQAILERRSLLLSPNSAWNALVRAEHAANQALHTVSSTSKSTSNCPSPPTHERAGNESGDEIQTGAGAGVGAELQVSAQV